MIDGIKKYSPEEAEFQLKKPFSQQIGVAETFLKLIGEPQKRIPVNIISSQSIYNGGWYFQGEAPTCLPWSIAGAAYSLGLTVNSRLMADLLNHANRGTSPEEQGMSYEKALEFWTGYQDKTDFSLVEVETKRKLSGNPDKVYRAIGLPIDTPQKTEYFKTWAVGDNAQKIKRYIDQSKRLLVSIRASDLLKDLAGSSHAVGIAGYRAYDHAVGTVMDVQIIDPSRGVFWLPSEHLYEALLYKPQLLMSQSRLPSKPFRPVEVEPMTHLDYSLISEVLNEENQEWISLTKYSS